MQLPLMPLNSVLFPGMPIPLFIFEQRYREMIDQCRDEMNAFGVALMRDQEKTEGSARLWEIGTTASIVRALELEEGGLHVLAVGTERFRLLEIVQEEPYMIAEVQLLDEDDGLAVPAELQDEMRELFHDHLRLVLQLLGQPDAEIKIPDSASRLSFMVAAHLTCPAAARQRLLEMDNLAQRFFHEKRLLARESEEYRLLLASRRKYHEVVGKIDEGVFSLN